MSVVSNPSRKKTWRNGRERVSVLAALAIEKESVSRRLSKLREDRGDPVTGKPLPQERAAARVGVTMRQWQRWESGVSVPYPRNLEAIAEAFDFDVAEFFAEDGPQATTTPDPISPEPPAWARQLQQSVDESRRERANVELQVQGLLEEQNKLLKRQSELLANIEAMVLSESAQDALEAARQVERTHEQDQPASGEAGRASGGQDTAG